MCLLNQSPNHRVDRTAATPEDVAAFARQHAGEVLGELARHPRNLSHV
jgi:hypothetical protein